MNQRIKLLVVLDSPWTDEALDDLQQSINVTDASIAIQKAMQHAGFTVVLIKEVHS